MRKRFVWTLFAVVGWGFFQPTPWANVAQAQTVILDVTSSCTASDAQNPRGAGFFAKAYPITMQAGVTYTVAFYTFQFQQNFQSGWTYDDYLYILGPNGAVAAQDDNGGDTLQAQTAFTPTTTGTYTVIVTTFAPNLSMQFRCVVNGPTVAGIPNVRLAPRLMPFGEERLLCARNLNLDARSMLSGADDPSSRRCWISGPAC
jgi:hypothetical protein